MTGAGSQRTRIALVHLGDPLSPQSWSGTPVGIASGLREAGMDVVPIDARPPASGRIAHRLKMSWAQQAGNPAFATMGSIAASLRLARAGKIGGAVAIGSGFRLMGSFPTVTFEDMTVAQAMRRDDPVFDALSHRTARRWQSRQQRIYRKNRACCVASAWTRSSIVEDYGIEPSKVHVVGFGRNADGGWVERDWAVPRFLWVGADWERKRGDATLAAFATVRERHPEARLDMVGNHPPIDAEGVYGHGRLALDSERDQAKYEELIRRATCFLMPSTYEPFGIAYVDAGATGLPSIGTTVGGAADAIGSGGLLVDPNDREALPAAMLELCDPAMAQRLGEQALRRSALFTWQAVAERLLRALSPPGVALESLAAFVDPADSPGQGRQ